MKKMLLIASALMMISAAVYAGPYYYMGLYSDEGHSFCSYFNPGGLTQIEMYIFVLPGDPGLKAAQFNIIYPSNVIKSTVTCNPDLLPTFDCTEGICATFMSCHTDWVWTHHQTLYVKDTTPSFIKLQPYPGEQYLLVSSCEDGYPEYHARLLNNLALNQECVIADEETSWGAIKDMYKR